MADQHVWQRINALKRINEQNEVEWAKVCVRCNAERRTIENPDGQEEVRRTDPDPLPRECVRYDFVN